jgi:hypothetical protein
MKVNKKLIIPASALIMAGAGVASVSAATSLTAPSLAQEIAQKFHLDQSQVQSVINQHRGEVQQNREARYEQRLTDAVNSGQITASQKQAILDEHNKLLSEIKASTGGNRRPDLQNVRQEAKDWASQNNIDVKWLLPVRHMVAGPAADANATTN